MSYLRLSSKGKYCDLGEGSYVYAFGNGSGQIINQGMGRSIQSEELAGAILKVFRSVGVSSSELESELEEEFGGISEIGEYPYPEPEMGEIACRVVFDRLDVSDLDPSVTKQISSKFKPTYTSCKNCGNDTRVARGNTENVYCDKDECRQVRERKMDEKIADKFGYDSVEEYREKELDS
jgi:hypothetical protein